MSTNTPETDKLVNALRGVSAGRSVIHLDNLCRRLERERDKFLSLLKRAEPHMRHGLNCPARIGEGHGCECGMLDVWEAAKEAIQ
jgi:hypothetical protein